MSDQVYSSKSLVFANPKSNKNINDIIEKVKNLEKITINTLQLYKNDVENLAKKLLEKETIDYTDIIDTLDQSLENTLSIKFEN